MSRTPHNRYNLNETNSARAIEQGLAEADWLNNALYEVASFMVMRESTVWRWSHTRHHSDTIIVGRDPEIAVPRPPDIPRMLLGFLNYNAAPKYFRNIVAHACGRMDEAQQSFIPASEHQKVFFKARVYLLIHAAVIAAAMRGARRNLSPTGSRW